MVSLREGSIDLFTRVQCFKRVIMKVASCSLGLEVLRCYYFQGILVKVNHKGSLGSRGRKIDPNSAWVEIQIYIVKGTGDKVV